VEDGCGDADAVPPPLAAMTRLIDKATAFDLVLTNSPFVAS
jgi:hypothetical protein